MIIIIDQTIRDQGHAYEAGNHHTVGVSITIDAAERLVASGWAHIEGAAHQPAVPADVTLDVQSATIGQRADNVG